MKAPPPALLLFCWLDNSFTSLLLLALLICLFLWFPAEPFTPGSLSIKLIEQILQSWSWQKWWWLIISQEEIHTFRRSLVSVLRARPPACSFLFLNDLRRRIVIGSRCGRLSCSTPIALIVVRGCDSAFGCNSIATTLSWTLSSSALVSTARWWFLLFLLLCYSDICHWKVLYYYHSFIQLLLMLLDTAGYFFSSIDLVYEVIIGLRTAVKRWLVPLMFFGAPQKQILHWRVALLIFICIGLIRWLMVFAIFFVVKRLLLPLLLIQAFELTFTGSPYWLWCWIIIWHRWCVRVIIIDAWSRSPSTRWRHCCNRVSLFVIFWMQHKLVVLSACVFCDSSLLILSVLIEFRLRLLMIVFHFVRVADFEYIFKIQVFSNFNISFNYLKYMC